MNSYLDLYSEVIKKADTSRYSNGDKTRLFNLGPFALFSKIILTTSSGKHLEDICHAHIVSLMYKRITSSRGNDDLSFGFDRDHIRTQRELTNNKNIKGKYLISIMLNDVFCCAEHQEKATCGFN